nr:hypothetical protein [Tanacetum cinerariifolium]
MQEDLEVQKVVKVVNAAKLMTEVATTAASIPIPAVEPVVAAVSTHISAAKPKKEEEEIIKSINETPAQKAAKRRRLHEQAKEAEDLKKQLEVVADEDDDVFVEATP